ncbi:MAG: MEKHLA domain-containing protein [Synechococcus sp.]|uniref:MEKHLA domain-containing protein n=1 Tax=Synechococcus sp. BMK-MC-1 TaxID=1442551 RepID=UPI0016491469|nr:MEKHLA domain-containing protein [Synechococcus sp. BMK-MC-1]QNI69004.1 bacterial MEKHLA protein [Synechococcus sp. BMK-MC-1]
MPETAPWQTREMQGLVSILLLSHRRAFDCPLLASDRPGTSRRLTAQELFNSSMAVLAHNNAGDPALTYANATALRLWKRPWSEMVGMPSRLTAAQSERKERAASLKLALVRDAINTYSGIRVDRCGRQFMIHNARIWTLWDEEGRRCGQAAAFNSWWWL